MRAVVQRVNHSSVVVEGDTIGQIGSGFMILLGVSFSLVPAAMWPSMVKLVREKEIGTAYGLTYSIQNLGLWGFPILAGMILDRTNPGSPEVLNYTPTILMFAGLGLLGLLFGALLKWEDKRKGFGVELPLNKKSQAK